MEIKASCPSGRHSRFRLVAAGGHRIGPSYLAVPTRGILAARSSLMRVSILFSICRSRATLTSGITLRNLGRYNSLTLNSVALDRHHLVDHGLGLLRGRAVVDLGEVLNKLLQAVSDFGHLAAILPVQRPEGRALGVGQAQVGRQHRLAIGLDLRAKLLELIGLAGLGEDARRADHEGHGEDQNGSDDLTLHVHAPFLCTCRWVEVRLEPDTDCDVARLRRLSTSSFTVRLLVHLHLEENPTCRSPSGPLLST